MSHVKTDKLSARTASGTITLGESGETFSLPSGTTLNISSGAAISNAGTASGFGGGKVLQVVNQIYENAEISFSSTSFVDLGTNTDVTITPSSTSNKILYLANIGYRVGGTETTSYGYIKIVRDDTTDLGSELFVGRHMYSGSFAQFGSGSFMYLDSPSTTSAITYSMYGKKNDAGSVVHLSNGSTNHTLSVTAIELEY